MDEVKYTFDSIRIIYRRLILLREMRYDFLKIIFKHNFYYSNLLIRYVCLWRIRVAINSAEDS